MKMKAEGTYRPVRKDDKKITKRERRLGRVLDKLDELGLAERDKALPKDSPKRKKVRLANDKV